MAKIKRYWVSRVYLPTLRYVRTSRGLIRGRLVVFDKLMDLSSFLFWKRSKVPSLFSTKLLIMSNGILKKHKKRKFYFWKRSDLKWGDKGIRTRLTKGVSNMCFTKSTLVMCHVYLVKVPRGTESLRTNTVVVLGNRFFLFPPIGVDIRSLKQSKKTWGKIKYVRWRTNQHQQCSSSCIKWI